jgi:hypothetical protein
MAFTPLACNSFGQQAPLLVIYFDIRGLCLIKRKNVGQLYSYFLPTPLPWSVGQCGLPEDAAPQIQTFQLPRQNCFSPIYPGCLITISGGFSERVFGRIFAMQSYPENPDFFRRHILLLHHAAWPCLSQYKPFFFQRNGPFFRSRTTFFRTQKPSTFFQNSSNFFQNYLFSSSLF